MKKLDKYIQLQRIKKAADYIRGNTVLDVGCHHGELFEYILKYRSIAGDGIDPVLNEISNKETYSLYPGYFPADLPVQKRYDCITLLAVLEHIPLKTIETFPNLFKKYLRPNGRVIITVPSKSVDYILNVLLFLRVIKGMDLEHHQDFERNKIKKIFLNQGYSLISEKKFELGLNNLYVFEGI
jgi:2-polyprenyl-3-methyl-5-hydroxy-6-metoxy-1,4-benzoquinol methylase